MITRDQYNNALQWDFNPPLTPGQAKVRLGLDPNTIITDYEGMLRQLGHPKYQDQPLAEPSPDQTTPAEPESSLAQAAEQYARAGIPVFPLAPGTKNPLKGSHALYDATTDPDQIEKWWTETPEANIGSPIPAGYGVFDVDYKEGGSITQLGVIPKTAIARSGGNGGWHVWFKLDMAKPPKSQYPELPGIQVWGDGHYVVMPPSQVNRQYEWELPEGANYRNTPLGANYKNVADLPDHLLAILQPPKAKASDQTAVTEYDSAADFWVPQAIDKVRTGATRNNTGLWLAEQLRDSCKLSEDAAKAPMLDYQRAVDQFGDHPYTEAETLKTLRSVYSQEAREPAHAQKIEECGIDVIASLLFTDNGIYLG